MRQREAHSWSARKLSMNLAAFEIFRRIAMDTVRSRRSALIHASRMTIGLRRSQPDCRPHLASDLLMWPSNLRTSRNRTEPWPARKGVLAIRGRLIFLGPRPTIGSSSIHDLRSPEPRLRLVSALPALVSAPRPCQRSDRDTAQSQSTGRRAEFGRSVIPSPSARIPPGNFPARFRPAPRSVIPRRRRRAPG